MVITTRLFLIFLLLPLSSLLAQKPVIRLALASSLVPLMEEITTRYEVTHQVHIELIPGASGTLTNQILHGAPYDIFIAANPKYTKLLKEQGYTLQVENWIRGALVLWTDQAVPEYEVNNDQIIINYLLQPDIKTIAIAQPGLAPYGDAALSLLSHWNVHQKIRDKLIFGVNVSVTNQYIYTRSVDAVITALSTKFHLESKVKGSWYNINFESSNQLVQSIAQLNNFPRENVEEFYNYLLSLDLEDIYALYGYQPITKKNP